MIYDYQYHQEVRKRWLILLALLINLAMLFFIFILEMKNNWADFKPERTHDAPIIMEDLSQPPALQQPEPEAQEQLELQTDEVAALKPRASIFGATDEVDDEPEFMPGTTDSETKFEDGTGDQAEDSLEMALAKEGAAEQKLQEAEQAQQHAAQKAQEEAHVLAQEAAQERARQEAEAIKQGLTTLQTKLEEAQKKIEKEKVAALTAAQQAAKATKNNTGSGTKNASPIKRELTFADLAQGFVESFKNEGNDWFERAGNENIRPQQKELKYLSYYKKLLWHLQNAVRYYRIDDINVPGSIQYLEASFILTFNRDGSMKARLMKGSGNNAYDYSALQALQSPYEYPPIPQHIPDEVITFPVTFYTRAERERIHFSFR